LLFRGGATINGVSLPTFPVSKGEVISFLLSESHVLSIPSGVSMIGNSGPKDSCHVSSEADTRSPRRPTIWYGNNTIADIKYCFGVPQVFVGDQLWRSAIIDQKDRGFLSFVDPNVTITLMGEVDLDFMNLQIAGGSRILLHDNSTSLRLFNTRLIMMPGSLLGAPSTRIGRLVVGCASLELADPSVCSFLSLNLLQHSPSFASQDA
jgi:hypothetical protein